MNLKSHALKAVVGVFVILASPAFAQSAEARDEHREDRIVWHVHQANQQEIKESSLAQQKSQSAAVRDFAKRMLAEHQAAEEQVRAYASSHQIDLDAVGRELQKRNADRLEYKRRSRTVGSATGEWAYTWENTLESWDENQKVLARLSKLDGGTFDREFVQRMIDEHQQVIDRLTIARDRGVSSSLGELINGLLPTLKQHLDMARTVQEQIAKA
jgi:putative membrane protein